MTYQSSLLSIEVVKHRGHTVLRLAGELDISSSELVLARSDDLVVHEVDLRDVTFIDSTGLRSLWSLHQRCMANGSALILRSPSPAVSRVLDVTGLRSELQVRDAEGPDRL